MVKVRSSRRVAGLKPGDYDHEIGLIDHDQESSSRSALSSTSASRRVSTVSRPETIEEEGQRRPSGDASHSQDAASSRSNGPEQGRGESANAPERQEPLEREESLPQASIQPSIEIQAATPGVFGEPTYRPVRRRPREKRETAVDVMYENERGGFLCGVALFSSNALGALDTEAWTNVFHKPSPTNIHNAEVPDPSWEWLWPEWQINYQDDLDDGGWEYSFAFSHKFSWHGPKWWNSFVRRRAWIRKRAKKRPEDVSSDMHLLGSDYFTVRSASHRSSQGSSRSLASSRVPSRLSMAASSAQGIEEGPVEIEDIDTLLDVLRFSRIDREKREAVENYLEHALDLELLQKAMHEIMSTFVFQASRRQLLGHLMQKYDAIVHQLEDGQLEDDPDLQLHKRSLEAAVKHADEEVSRLAYWSDVKRMAEKGEVRLSLDDDQGWYDARPGLDRSGPSAPRVKKKSKA